MKRLFAAALFFAISVSSYCSAVVPIDLAKGPPASLQMEVHNGTVHEIYLTRPTPLPSYVPGRVKIMLSRGEYPDRFQIELAYAELPDGRIYFRVDTPKEAASEYVIQAIDMPKGPIWYELFSGKLSEIPTAQAGQVK
jgi:hypothetical protein